jgi:four helix bundle protein
MAELIRSHRDLDVYKLARGASIDVFSLTKSFPDDERFGLTSQIRRSSRSVRVNIVESWRKRRYKSAFIAKLSDAETEAAETQEWLQVVVECKYVDRAVAANLYKQYDKITRTLIGMITHADKWTIRTPSTAD